ncbi:MAG: hypothetical protein F6K26_08650 [Moorea sp. SIO2I5]|nr:hypothetical protein [Moorena sp. SIO2I5]
MVFSQFETQGTIRKLLIGLVVLPRCVPVELCCAQLDIPRTNTTASITKYGLFV